MDLILNDLLKFRRSHVWAVAFLVPVVAVAIGAGNYAANTGTLTASWGSYFSQVMLFYGLLFCTAGIAILAAAAWRVEHRGHNWLTMLTSTRSVGNLVASKIAAIAVTVRCTLFSSASRYSSVGRWGFPVQCQASSSSQRYWHWHQPLRWRRGSRCCPWSSVVLLHLSALRWWQVSYRLAHSRLGCLACGSSWRLRCCRTRCGWAVPPSPPLERSTLAPS